MKIKNLNNVNSKTYLANETSFKLQALDRIYEYVQKTYTTDEPTQDESFENERPVERYKNLSYEKIISSWETLITEMNLLEYPQFIKSSIQNILRIREFWNGMIVIPDGSDTLQEILDSNTSEEVEETVLTYTYLRFEDIIGDQFAYLLQLLINAVFLRRLCKDESLTNRINKLIETIIDIDANLQSFIQYTEDVMSTNIGEFKIEDDSSINMAYYLYELVIKKYIESTGVLQNVNKLLSKYKFICLESNDTNELHTSPNYYGTLDEFRDKMSSSNTIQNYHLMALPEMNDVTKNNIVNKVDTVILQEYFEVLYHTFLQLMNLSHKDIVTTFCSHNQDDTIAMIEFLSNFVARPHDINFVPLIGDRNFSLIGERHPFVKQLVNPTDFYQNGPLVKYVWKDYINEFENEINRDLSLCDHFIKMFVPSLKNKEITWSLILNNDDVNNETKNALKELKEELNEVSKNQHSSIAFIDDKLNMTKEIMAHHVSDFKEKLQDIRDSEEKLKMSIDDLYKAEEENKNDKLDNADLISSETSARINNLINQIDELITNQLKTNITDQSEFLSLLLQKLRELQLINND